MGSLIAQYGAMATLNHLSGYAFPAVASTAPSWYPGLTWVDDSTDPPTIQKYNGSAWSPIESTPRYIALLTADPSTSGTNSTPAVYISDLAELTTSGYSRQAVSFSAASSAYPAVASNTAVITFGPMTAAMTSAAGWLALVDVANGLSGYLLCTWALTESMLVSTGQSIQIAIGELVLDQA
jgi:hypothetical protein